MKTKRRKRKEPEEDSKYEGKSWYQVADGRRKSWGAKF